MPLITLQQASDHLRLDIDFGSSPVTDPRKADLELKVAAAEAIVRDYLKVSSESPPWEPAAKDEYVVKAAALLVLSALWDDREGAGNGDYLKSGGAAASLLHRLRDPALA